MEVAAEGARGARAAYLLDGAHTIESVESGARWAAEQGAQGRAGGARAWRVLVFYCSGDPPPSLLLPLLMSLLYTPSVDITAQATATLLR